MRLCFSSTALGSAISVLECSPVKSPYLLVILASGACKIWNIETRKLALSDTIEMITHVSCPIYPNLLNCLLHDSALMDSLPKQVTSSEYPRLTLLRCQVTSKGQPIITFAKSNPDAKGGASLVSFTFDSSMESWYVVC
jgi:hypothetical protein